MINPTTSQPAHGYINESPLENNVSDPLYRKGQVIAKCKIDNLIKFSPKCSEEDSSPERETLLRRRHVFPSIASASVPSVNCNAGSGTDRADINDSAEAESGDHTGNAGNSRQRGSSRDSNEPGCAAGPGRVSSANRIVAGFAGMAGSTAVRAIREAVDLSNPFNCVTTIVQHAPALLSAVADNDSPTATLAKYSAMAMTGAGIATSVCAAASATSAISAAAILGTCATRLVGQAVTHTGVQYLLCPQLPDSIREYAAPWLHAGTEIVLAAISPMHTRTPDGTDYFTWPGGKAACTPELCVAQTMGKTLVSVPSPELSDLPPSDSLPSATEASNKEFVNGLEFMNGVKIFNRDGRSCITANRANGCFEGGEPLSIWSATGNGSGNSDSGGVKECNRNDAINDCFEPMDEASFWSRPKNAPETGDNSLSRLHPYNALANAFGTIDNLLKFPSAGAVTIPEIGEAGRHRSVRSTDDLLNCFSEIAVSRFGNITSMPGWFWGEVALTVAGEQHLFTVLMGNDGTSDGRQIQASLCNDSNRLRTAIRYFIANLNGSPEDVPEAELDSELWSMPAWIPEHSLDRKATIINWTERQLLSFRSSDSLDSTAEMYLVLNAPSSPASPALTKLEKIWGYGMSALKIKFLLFEYKGVSRHDLNYEMIESMYFREIAFMDFTTGHNDFYPVGWNSEVLNIPISDKVGDVSVTGYLSSSSLLKKIFLTSNDLINSAVNNLVPFVTEESLVQTEHFDTIPGDHKVSASIQEGYHSISLEDGGEQNQLIIHPGSTPVFGQFIPAVMVSMETSDFDNSVEIKFYRKLKIINPNDASNSTVPLPPDHFFPKADGSCFSTVMINHGDDIGSWRSDVEIMSPNGPGKMPFDATGEFILSSLLLRNSRTIATTIPDDAQLMLAFERKFVGNGFNLLINGTETSQQALFESSIQPGTDLLRLWLFPRADVVDERNPQITVFMTSDDVTDSNTVNYQLYVPKDAKEIPYQNVFVQQPRLINDDQNEWRIGRTVIPMDAGNVTHFALRFAFRISPREILGGYPILMAAAQMLECHEFPTESCKSLKTELPRSLAGRLNLNPDDISINEFNVAHAYPNKMPPTNRLILSRYSLDAANNHTAVIVDVDNDVSSASFSCYKEGTCPAYLPKIDSENGVIGGSYPNLSAAGILMPDVHRVLPGGWTSIEPTLNTDLFGPIEFTVDVKSTSAMMDYLLSKQQVLANLLLAYNSPLQLKVEDYKSELGFPLIGSLFFPDVDVLFYLKEPFDYMCSVAKNQLRIWLNPPLIRSGKGNDAGNANQSAILLTVELDEVNCAKTLELSVYIQRNSHQSSGRYSYTSHIDHLPNHVIENYKYNFIADSAFAGWQTSSLRIPYVGPDNNIRYSQFIGYVSTTSKEFKSYLTSRDVIETAGNNLIKFITEDAPSFSPVKTPYTSAIYTPYEVLIQDGKQSIELDQGGNNNQLIIYPGPTPAFGRSVPAVVIGSRVTYYRALTIAPPPGKTNTCS